jgi:hypothetical protein
MKKWQSGDILKEDEYLFIQTKHLRLPNMNIGFFTKYTQKGDVPKNFLSWKNLHKECSDFYVIKEVYREGWKIIAVREGESRNWVLVMHPLNFILEIYLNNFIELCKSGNIEKGELIGMYKWEKNCLLKNDTI